MQRFLKQLQRWWPTRIRYQLICGVALVHLLLMTIFVFDLVGRQCEFLKQQSLEATQGLAQTLAVNSVSWVLANDVVGLEEIVRSVRQYPDLRYAMVVSADGQVLAHTDVACIGRYLDDDTSRTLLTAEPKLHTLYVDHTLLDIAAPVVTATGKPIAWARVGQSQEPIWKSLRVASRNGVLYTLLAIAVGSILAVLISNRLTSGLNRLLSVSGQIRDGRRDLRMEVQRDDEVSRLGEGINQMLEAITSSEERLQRLNRELRAVSDCNEILMRATDEQTLLNDVCHTVCHVAGYRMAWVGFAEHDAAQTVRPVAWAGDDNGYLADAHITWADTERGRGPTGTAIRTGASVSLQDFAASPEAAPWREQALQRGYRASIALPLKNEHGSVLGVLNIYAAEPNAFTPNEVRLLEELAGDLAYGLGAIRTRIAHARAEEALQQSEALYRSVITAMAEGACLQDANGTILAVNPAAERIEGRSAEQLIGRTSEDPQRGAICEDGSPFPGALHPAMVTLRTGEPQSDVVMGIHQPDGTLVWISVNSQPVMVPGGGSAPHAVVTTFRDITERKQAEELLHKREREFRALVENSQDIIARYDRDCRRVYVNPVYLRTARLPQQELLGTAPAEHSPLPPAGAVKLQGLLRGVLDSGVPAAIDLAMPEADHTQRWFNIHVVPEFDQEGRVVSVLSTSRDITERKRAEEQLQQSERSKTIHNQIADIFLTVPDDAMYGGVLAVVLQALGSRFGVFGFIGDDGDLVIPSMTRAVWEQCQVADKSIVFSPASWGASLWGRAIREQRAFSSDGPFHTPGGHVRIDHFLTAPIVNASKTIGLLSVANGGRSYTAEDRDLLESIAGNIAPILNARLQRDRQERERRRAEERIAAQLREKELLLREIHHRVKNNMQVITGLLDLQARQAGNEQFRELLAASRDRIRTMAMVHERLYTAQDMSRVDLRDYIQALVTESLRLYGVNPGQVEVRASVEQRAFPIATAIPCGLIIHELLSNALRHAFPAGRTGRIEISVVQASDAAVELAVQDNGVGVPEGLNIETTPSLGLRLVQILAVDQLGGTVRMARENGTGIHIRFPAERS